MGGSGALVVGIDAGTSGCKVVVVSEHGKLAGQGWAGYPSRSGDSGAITQSADDWVGAMQQATRDSLSTLDGSRVEAISVTAPGYNAVLLDADDRPTADVMLWSDPRPTANAATLRDRHEEVLRERAMVTLGPSHTLSQLHWIAAHEPERFGATRRIAIGKDYLRRVLTGDHASDPSNLASTGMFDPRSLAWIDELVGELGLDPACLPDVVSPFDSPGGVSGDWAARLGVRAGVPVAVGANDTSTELVSVGATLVGSGLVKIASTGTVVVVDDRPHLGGGLLTYPHVEPGLWYTLAATNTAGSALAWLSRNVFGEAGDRDDLARIEARAATAPPGCDGLLAFPWVAGERAALSDADVRAAFIGAGIGHDQAHFTRAVMEAAAYGLADCRDLLAADGLRVETPVLTGGGLRSGLWREIVLAVLDTAAVVRTPCEPALGAALVAARSVGLEIDLGGVEIEQLAADPELISRYVPLRRRHRELVPAVSLVSRRD